jgi:transcriptional regulator with XRE-family HTH domain/predicted RNase H-like HicB family nuclease
MKYLVISGQAQNADNYVAWFADPLPAVATGKTREAAIAKLQAMHTDAYFGTKGQVLPKAQSLEDVNPEEYEEIDDVQVSWLELGYINPMAYTLWEAMNVARCGPAELARRMGISRAAGYKLLDPNRASPYSLDTLERIAQALGMQLEPPKFVPVVGSSQAMHS